MPSTSVIIINAYVNHCITTSITIYSNDELLLLVLLLDEIKGVHSEMETWLSWIHVNMAWDGHTHFFNSLHIIN